MLSVVDLRCQVPAGVLTIGAEPVRLTWRVEPAVPDLAQEACVIEVSETDDFANVTLSSGILEGEGQIGVEAPGGALTSRETRFYRVRIRTQVGWTDWSPTLRVEAGLLRGRRLAGARRDPAG